MAPQREQRADQVYTDPALRERLRAEIRAGDRGGKAGQWSARKAQFLAQEYEKAGGGYCHDGALTDTQRHLRQWTEEAWTTADGAPAEQADGTMRRYLPREAWEQLTPAQRRATDGKKRQASRSGGQFVANTTAAAKATRDVRAAHATSTPHAGAQEHADTVRDFRALVNMTPKQLEKWLVTEDSQAVGGKKARAEESVGHHQGHVIIALLGKKKRELTEGDVHEMGRVRSYIKRHLAQRPEGDVRDTRWRYSLMNWGHDPCKSNAAK